MGCKKGELANIHTRHTDFTKMIHSSWKIRSPGPPNGAQWCKLYNQGRKPRGQYSRVRVKGRVNSQEWVGSGEEEERSKKDLRALNKHIWFLSSEVRNARLQGSPNWLANRVGLGDKCREPADAWKDYVGSALFDGPSEHSPLPLGVSGAHPWFSVLLMKFQLQWDNGFLSKSVITSYQKVS